MLLVFDASNIFQFVTVNWLIARFTCGPNALYSRPLCVAMGWNCPDVPGTATLFALSGATMWISLPPSMHVLRDSSLTLTQFSVHP